MEKFGKSFFDGGEVRPGFYSRYEWETHRQEFGGLADLLTNRCDPRTVLDLGCAKGFLVEAMMERGCDAYGTDISEYALRTALEETRGRLLLADLNHGSLPFPSGYFDLIVCMGCCVPSK